SAVCTLAELHADISTTSEQCLRALEVPAASNDTAPAPRQAAVAIVGMAGIFPGAPNVERLWSNILNSGDAITEVPADRWDWRAYFDADRAAPDRIYSRWGGFIDDVAFDPVDYGMPPSALNSIEPFQLLSLALVRAALADAGFDRHPFPREK